MINIFNHGIYTTWRSKKVNYCSHYLPEPLPEIVMRETVLDNLLLKRICFLFLWSSKIYYHQEEICYLWYLFHHLQSSFMFIVFCVFTLTFTLKHCTAWTLNVPKDFFKEDLIESQEFLHLAISSTLFYFDTLASQNTCLNIGISDSIMIWEFKIWFLLVLVPKHKGLITISTGMSGKENWSRLGTGEGQ